MNTAFPVLLVFVLALVGVTADSLIKKAAVGESQMWSPWLIAGLLIYALTAFGWFVVMKTMKLSSIGLYYSLSTALFLVLAGFLFFGERMNMYEWAGVFFGIISLVLLGRFA